MARERKKQPGVMIYFDIRAALERLGDAEKGRLLMAYINYGEYGEVPEFEGELGMAWAFIKPKLDLDREHYEKKCEKASQAVRKRWQDTDEYGRIQTNTFDTNTTTTSTPTSTPKTKTTTLSTTTATQAAAPKARTERARCPAAKAAWEKERREIEKMAEENGMSLEDYLNNFPFYRYKYYDGI